MNMATVQDAHQSSAHLVDVREYPEYASGAIRGSQLVPLAELAARSSAWPRNRPLLMVCKSGRRATNAAETLEQLGFTDVTVLQGGVDAWRSHGLPLDVLENSPWALERQVRVVAGGLILGFSVLGFTVSPKMFFGAAAVGAGLVFAGVSNTCMMGSVLGKMPWNQPTSQRASPGVPS